MDTYNYEPLDSTSREIRLLRIQPSAQFSAQVKCEIFKTTLEAAPYYVALSYCWGDQSNPNSILLNGYFFPVGISLYLALRRLRDEQEPVIYWADAICIDQKNDKERGHQVSMMRDIYERADIVHVWLGEVAQGSALAFGLIQTWTIVENISADELNAFILKYPISFKPSS